MLKFIALLCSLSISLPVFASSFEVDLFHFNFFSPELTPQIVKFEGVTQIGFDTITDGSITIQIADLGGQSVNIDRLSRQNVKPNDLERYTLQVLHALQVGKKFYQSLGIEVPNFTVTLQDAETPPLAVTSGMSIRVTKMDVNYSLSDVMPLIGDVMIHELTHIIQAGSTLRLLDSRIGPTSYEGHANLMTYMVVGRTDLGVLNGQAGMTVLTNDKFGRLNGGNYNTYQPFSSILVKIHQLILNKGSSLERKKILHVKVAKIFLEMLSRQESQDTFQNLLRKVIQSLLKSNLISTSDLPFVRTTCLEHGIDLYSSDFGGYTSGVLVNGAGTDVTGDSVLEDTIKNGLRNPMVRIQKGLLSEMTNGLSLTGIIVKMPDSFAKLNEILTKKRDAFQRAGRASLDKAMVQKMILDAWIEVAKQGMDLGGVFVDKAIYTIKNDEEFEISARPTSDTSQCFKGYAPGALLIFSPNGEQLAQGALLFKCNE